MQKSGFHWGTVLMAYLSGACSFIVVNTYLNENKIVWWGIINFASFILFLIGDIKSKKEEPLQYRIKIDLTDELGNDLIKED